jgi:hypothetical protein
MRDEVKIRIKIDVKGNGQECPFHTGRFAVGKQQVPHRAFGPVRNDKELR